VLPAIVKQHAKNTETLRSAGYTSVARVQLRALREMMGIEEGAFYQVIDELEASGLILREHGLARPIGVS
jgi:DNA-binding MarR family transcriptional regulator